MRRDATHARVATLARYFILPQCAPLPPTPAAFRHGTLGYHARQCPRPLARHHPHVQSSLQPTPVRETRTTRFASPADGGPPSVHHVLLRATKAPTRHVCMTWAPHQQHKEGLIPLSAKGKRIRTPRPRRQRKPWTTRVCKIKMLCFTRLTPFVLLTHKSYYFLLNKTLNRFF